MTGKSSVTRAEHGEKLTYDDFLLFPDDGKRHELIDGVHYVTPSPNLKHQAILGNLHLIIASWLETHDAGRVFLSPFDVLLSRFDVVEPDLLFIAGSRTAEILTPLNVQGSPDLAVEIASKSTRRRDEIIKRRLYERAGVAEYWIVDPVADTVRVFRRHGDAFTRVEELSRASEDVLRTPLLPGLELPLFRIFKNT